MLRNIGTFGPSRFELVRFIITVLNPYQWLVWFIWLLPFGIGLWSLLKTGDTILVGGSDIFTWVMLISGTIGGIFGIVNLYKLFYSKPRRSLLLLKPEEFAKKNNLGAVVWPSGFTYHESPNNQGGVIVSDKLDEYLRSNSIPVKFKKEPREKLIGYLREHRKENEDALRSQFEYARARHKMFKDEPKLSLASDIQPNDSPVTVFKGSYFFSFLTNEMCQREWSAGRQYVEESPTTADCFATEVSSDNKILKSIAESSFGNHIGVSTLAFTSDKKLVLWMQKSSAIQSAGLRQPTGSGSSNWTDLKGCTTINQAVIKGMERELSEESLIPEIKKGKCKCDTAILGYFRWINRGGKPEFVGISKISLSSVDLRPDGIEVYVSRKESQCYEAGTFEELMHTLDGLLKDSKISISLWRNLVVLKDVLHTEKKRWTEFLGIE